MASLEARIAMALYRASKWMLEYFGLPTGARPRT